MSHSISPHSFQHPSLPLSRSMTFRQLLPSSGISHPTARPESHVAVMQTQNLFPTPDVGQLHLSGMSCDPPLSCLWLKEQAEVVVPGCCRGAGREGMLLSSTAHPFCRAPLSPSPPSPGGTSRIMQRDAASDPPGLREFPGH